MALTAKQLQARVEQMEKRHKDNAAKNDTKNNSQDTTISANAASITALQAGNFAGITMHCLKIITSNSTGDGVNTQNTFTGTTGTRVATGSGVTYTSATAGNINTISASFDTLATKYNSLVAKHNNLLSVLQDAGIIGTIGGGTGLEFPDDPDEIDAAESLGLRYRGLDL